MQISQTMNRVIAVHAVLFVHLTNIFNTVGAYLTILLFREEGDLSNSLQSKPAYAWNQLQHLRSVENQQIWLLQKTQEGHRSDLEILVTIRALSFVQTHIHLVTSSTFLSMQVPLIWTPFAKQSLWKRSDFKVTPQYKKQSCSIFIGFRLILCIKASVCNIENDEKWQLWMRRAFSHIEQICISCPF